MKPFTHLEYIQPNYLEKLFKKEPSRNFLIDVNNALTHDTVSDIPENLINTLQNKYNDQSLSIKYQNDLTDLMRKFLINNLGDDGNINNSYESAKVIQRILCLSDDLFNMEHAKVSEVRFRWFVNSLLSKSRKYQDEEDSKIRNFAILIGLTDEKRENITNELRIQVLSEFMKDVLSDERVSPDEMAAAKQLSSDMNVDMSFGSQTELAISRGSLLWEIENGQIPKIEVDIVLGKNEECYCSTPVTLYENRSVTKRIGYAGPTFRVKIAKGLYYRVGDINVSRTTETVMTMIDQGMLYITNKRILFYGGKQNKVIKYNQIIDITPYSDGISIIKETGKPPVFQTSIMDGEILTAIVARVLKDNLQ
jgi:hypothetical protein